MEDNLLKLDMLGHDDPTMIRMLEDLTGVNARTIPLDDPDTMSIFTSSKVLGFENDDLLGPTGAVAIPEFNTRFTRQMLMDELWGYDSESDPRTVDTHIRRLREKLAGVPDFEIQTVRGLGYRAVIR